MVRRSHFADSVENEGGWAEGETRAAQEAISASHRAALPPEVEIRDDAEEDEAEGDEARDDAEPREHERAIVPARRRRGDSKHEVEPSEYFCQEFDHGAPEEMRRYGGSSVRHRSDFLFDFRDIHHDDGIPRAAIQEAAVRTFTEALFAPDALEGVNLDAPERRIVLVRHPEHAIFHRTIFNAGRRSSAAGAALRNNGQFFWLLLARGGDTLRAGFKLLLVGHHSGSLDNFGCVSHFQRFYLECQPFVSVVLAASPALATMPVQSDLSSAAHKCSPSLSTNTFCPRSSPDLPCASFSSRISLFIPATRPITKSSPATGCTTVFTASTPTGGFFPRTRAR